MLNDVHCTIYYVLKEKKKSIELICMIIQMKTEHSKPHLTLNVLIHMLFYVYFGLTS